MGKKKILKFAIPSIFILILVAGGFYYWQNQKDVRDLNKSLPEGVKVTKSLVGNEYRVVNKLDGYEFKVPMEWRGVSEIKYIFSSPEERYIITSINVSGSKGAGRNIAVDRFNIENVEDLETSAQKILKEFELVDEFTKDRIGDLEIIKTQENIHLLGDYMYFFQKNSIVYTITGGSEDFIREIISNGKW